MKIALIDNHSLYLQDLLLSLSSHRVQVLDLNRINLVESEDFDLIILSGGHDASVTNHPDYYQKELDFIQTANKPILGICLGFQLIIYAFGGKLEHLKHREKGELNLSTTDSDFTFLNNALVYENHIWKVNHLPESLLPKAYSKDGVEVIKHQTKPILGVQFHPEKSAPEILNQLIKICAD